MNTLIKTITGIHNVIEIHKSSGGGKAGKGNNKTATLQCRHPFGDGYLNKKHFIYTVGDEQSYQQALKKAIAWCEEFCEIPKAKEVSFRNTLAALTLNLAHDHNAYAFLYHRLGAGYMGVIGEMVHWATEFEAIFANTDWDAVDWYDTLDAYQDETLEEYGYNKEEKYDLYSDCPAT